MNLVAWPRTCRHPIILLKGLPMFQIDSWPELCVSLLTTESPNYYYFGYLVGHAKYGEVDCLGDLLPRTIHL